MGVNANATPYDTLSPDIVLDAIAAPANLLSVNLGGRPFSYALVEVISELEGFDNLRFTQVPEPSALTMLGIGCVACVTVARRTARGSKIVD